MEFNQRENITVFISNLKKVNQLKRFGSLFYVSKEQKYAILYTDQANAVGTVRKIKSLNFVKSAYISPRSKLKTVYRDDILEG